VWSTSQGFDNIQVLIIDDDEDMLSIVEFVLRDLGITRLRSTSNPKIAAQLISRSESAFDLIVCDWFMPDVTGLDLLKQSKKKNPAIKFVMLTAEKTGKSVITARNAQVDAYIAKPFSPEDLKKKLTAVLKRR
jgi:DNA-binding response OmpR family regulator